MARTALFGATGRLGTAMRSVCPGMLCFSRSGGDGTTGADLARTAPESLLQGEVAAAFNCASMSSTTVCGKNPAHAFIVNSLWPSRLALFCREHGIRLVHISTDLVWSGGTPPYRAKSPGVPMSIYGWTKLLGDRGVMRADPSALIVRTSVLVGDVGAENPTFSEDILSGRAKSFYADSIRHHTPIVPFAKTLLRLAAENTAGIVLAASPNAQCRLSYATGLIPDPEPCLAPRGVPKNLTLLPDVPIGF